MATVPKTDEEIWRAECAAEDALAAQELTAEQHLRAEAIALFDYGLDRLAVVSILGEDAVKAHEEHWEQCAKKVGDDEEEAVYSVAELRQRYDISRRSAAIAALDLGEGERADHVAVLGEAAVQAHEALYGTAAPRPNSLFKYGVAAATDDEDLALLLPPPQPSPAQLAYEAERSERAALARHALYQSLAKMRETVPPDDDDDDSEQGQHSSYASSVRCGLADCVHTLCLAPHHWM